jgi:hypothetical protein
LNWSPGYDKLRIENTEYDPDGAEEFVALIRALRKESSGPLTL